MDCEVSLGVCAGGERLAVLRDGDERARLGLSVGAGCRALHLSAARRIHAAEKHRSEHGVVEPFHHVELIRRGVELRLNCLGLAGVAGRRHLVGHGELVDAGFWPSTLWAKFQFVTAADSAYSLKTGYPSPTFCLSDAVLTKVLDIEYILMYQSPYVAGMYNNNVTNQIPKPLVLGRLLLIVMSLPRAQNQRPSFEFTKSEK